MAHINEKEIETREASHQPKAKTVQVETTELSGIGCHDGERNDATQPLSTTKRLTEQYWLFEIFALVMSMLGLLAVVIILRSTENRTVPTWSLQQPAWTTRVKKIQPVTVTINSVISLFSTSVKSTILIPVVAAMEELKWLWFKQERHLTDIQLFTNASKGPLGAINMLWSLRAKKISCLGAIIVVGALSLDFGFQQLVTYPVRRTAVDAPALVGRTNGYSAFGIGELTSRKSVELPMLAAIYKGLYSGNLSFPMSPVCVSGDCVWDEQYTSLGVCSQCYSTTDQLEKSCSTFDVTMTDDRNETFAVGSPVPYCNYTLPGSGDGQSIEGYWPNGTSPLPIVLSLSSNIASNKTYFGNGLNAHLGSFSIMRASWTSVYNDAGDRFLYYQLNQVNSTECGLDACVIRYQSAVNGTTLKEQVIDTFINTTDFIPEVLSGYPFPVIVPPAEWTNVSNDHGNNIFSIDPLASQAIRDKLLSIFLAASGTYTEAAATGTASSDFVSYLRYTDDTDVEKMMKSLAQSMTQRMRQAPGDGAFLGPGPNAVGVTYQLLPHVNVRWAWIAVPTTLVALSAIFLIATLTTVHSEGANMLWKSNALAYFYHPLTKDGRDLLRGAYSAKHAENIVEGMKVKWTETGAGGRFVIIR